MGKLTLILSFDYELPLGGASSYSKGIFAPTNRLIELASKYNTSVVLFADVLSAIQFKDWDMENYYLPFVDQLKKAISQKHDVQLHIHPHWLTTKYENGKIFPSKDFNLGDFDAPYLPFSINEIIKDSVSFLNENCTAVDSNYKCIAYRAGGYSISPNTERIFQCLADEGIQIESSIVKGFFRKTSYATIDFSNRTEEPNWFIMPGLYEVPIATMPMSLFSVLSRRIKKIRNKQEYNKRKYKNTGSSFPNSPVSLSLKEKWKMIKNPQFLTFDREHYNINTLRSILDYNIEKYREYDDVSLSLIGHPKSMGDYHFKLMEDFLKLLQNEYKDKVEVKTYQGIAKELNK